MTAAAFVFPLGRDGMIEASITRSPVTPRTRRLGSTTDVSAVPIAHDPVG
jgi:hypothetical protein